MKKLLSSFLSVLLILNVFIPAAYADNDTYNEKLNSYNFNDYTSSAFSTGTGYYDQKKNSSSVGKSEPGIGSDGTTAVKLTCLQELDSGAYNGYFWTESPGDIVTVMTVDLDILIGSDADITYQQSFGNTSRITVVSGGKVGEVSVNDATWHHITSEIDFKNSKYHIYLDGNDTPAYSADYTVTNSGTQAVRHWFRSASIDGTAYMMMDNLTYSARKPFPVILKAMDADGAELVDGKMPLNSDSLKLQFDITNVNTFYDDISYYIEDDESDIESVSCSGDTLTLTPYDMPPSGKPGKFVLSSSKYGGEMEYEFEMSSLDIISPVNGSVFDDNETLFSVIGDVDAIMVFKLDDDIIQKFDGSSDGLYEMSLSKSELSYGKHTFTVDAVRLGKSVESQSIEFTVSKTEIVNLTSYNLNTYTASSFQSGTGYYDQQKNNASVGKSEPCVGSDGTAAVKLTCLQQLADGGYNPYFYTNSPGSVSTAMIVNVDFLVCEDSDVCFEIMFTGTSSRVKVIDGGKIGSKNVNDGNWHHAKIKLDFAGSKYYVYLDGADTPTYTSDYNVADSGNQAVRLYFRSASTDGTVYMMLDNLVYDKETPGIAIEKAETLAGTEIISSLPLSESAFKLVFNQTIDGSILENIVIKYYIDGVESSIPSLAIDGTKLTVTPEKMPFAGQSGELVLISPLLDRELRYSFEMEKSDFSSESHSFVSGGVDIVYPEQFTAGNKIKSKIKLNNETNIEKDVLVIIAVYKDGVMTQISAVEDKVSANSDKIIVTGEVNTSSGCEVITYLCDTWCDRTPLGIEGVIILN